MCVSPPAGRFGDELKWVMRAYSQARVTYSREVELWMTRF